MYAIRSYYANENSIFIYDCIKARKLEFSSENIVKNQSITIPHKSKEVLYQGRKKAIKSEKNKTLSQLNNLRVNIFQNIYSTLSLLADISLIVIA